MCSSNFVGSIPQNYDQGLGPQIFEGFAEDLVDRVAELRPASVLELAAGTGIVTRKLRDRLDLRCEIVASDLNEPMLEVAKTKFASSERVRFEQIDATDVPYGDGAFDALVCQFGIMFFPDKPRSFAEARRTLCPGGTYLFNVWDSWARNRFAKIVHDTTAGFFPNDPPGFYKLPFSYHDRDEITAALSAAGYSDITIEQVPLTSAIPSHERFARGLVFGNPLYEEITNRGGDADAIHAAVSQALEDQLGSSMQIQAIVVSARNP